jgi:hypothetical protein
MVVLLDLVTWEGARQQRVAFCIVARGRHGVVDVLSLELLT